MSRKIPEASELEKRITNQSDFTIPVQSMINPNAEVTNRRPMIKDIAFYPDQTYRPPTKPMRTFAPGSSVNIDINPELNIDLKKNSPF